jgi:hypothetical protein
MATFKTPKSLLDAYSNGLVGSISDPAATEQLLSELPMPLFGSAAQPLFGSGDGKLSLPYKSILKFVPNFGAYERQETGDCYKAGTIVLSEECKTIENVNIGDKIYGPDGSITTVISKKEKISYNPFITIKTLGSLPLTVTSDHLVFIAREDDDNTFENRQMSSVATMNGKVLTRQWIRAENIKKGDYLITPKKIDKPIKPVNKFTNHKDFEWFLGYFLGDGWCDNETLEITFAKEQTHFYDKCFKFLEFFGFNPRFGEYKTKKTNAFRLRCWCPELCSWLRKISYDNKKDKLFPFWAIGSKDIITGLVDSDGFRKEGKEFFNSKSKSLIYGVYYSYLALGYKPTVSNFIRSKKGSYKTKSDSYRVACIFNKKKQYSHVDEEYLYIQVKNIKIEEGKKTVYDIGVSHKDHAFIANGAIAHNCVSHAFRNGSDTTRAVEIDIKKEREGFIASGATEAIYGVRGHTGEGMTCSRAARFLNQDGGILLRKKYDNYDLSKYNGKLGDSWGRTGTPRELVEVAKQNQVKTVSLIKSVQEAKDAIANGYCLAVCSMYGFSSTRDKNGIAIRNGQWSHAMSWIGVDDTKERLNETLFLIQNSWGVWNSGPKFYEQPDGSFWIREQDAAGMIASGEAWALSNVSGFPPRKISWSIDEVF